MTKVAAIPAAVFVLIGCRIVDGYYPESTYQLHVVTARATSYTIRLSTDTSSGENLPSDGRIAIDVPEQLWGQKRLGSIPLSRANPQRHIEILYEGRVVKQIPLSSVAQLPHDDAGYSLVEL